MDRLFAQGTVNAAQSGKGPPLFLFHSLLSDRASFDAIVPELAKSFRVIVPELPGFGRSKAVTGGLAVVADRMAEAVRDAAQGEDAIVLGNGYGGFVALQMAIRHPDIAGKFVLAGLMQKLGITDDSAQRGANAAMFSTYEDFSPAGRERLDAFLDEVYSGFKQHVAAGRHLSAEQVEAVAKGRVWSGEEAKEKGLVDELGGYDVGLRLAQEAAKIPADKPFTLTVFPREKSTIERVYDRIFNSERDRDAASPTAAQGVMAGLVKLLADVETLAGDPGVLRMPSFGEIR